MPAALLKGGVTGPQPVAASYCSPAPSNPRSLGLPSQHATRRAGGNRAAPWLFPVRAGRCLPAGRDRPSGILLSRSSKVVSARAMVVGMLSQAVGWASPPHPRLQQRVPSRARPRVIWPGRVCCTGGRASVAQPSPSRQIRALGTYMTWARMESGCIARWPGRPAALLGRPERC